MNRYLVCVALLFSSAILAETATITVIDQQGKPLKNVVLSTLKKVTAKKNAPSIAIMDQVDKQFLPRVLTVSAGQSVKFPNSDNIRHHVYSFSKPKTFEIKLYSGTPSTPVLFESPGLVVLGCNIHDQMIGYIYVGESNAQSEELMTITDKQGQAKLDLLPEGEVKVWHERLPNITEPLIIRTEQIITNGYTIKIKLSAEENEKDSTKFERKFR